MGAVYDANGASFFLEMSNGDHVCHARSKRYITFSKMVASCFLVRWPPANEYNVAAPHSGAAYKRATTIQFGCSYPDRAHMAGKPIDKSLGQAPYCFKNY